MNLTNHVAIYDYNETAVELPLFQLLQWKHALALECKGLKFSRGSVTAHVRRFLSAPRTVTRDMLRAYLSDCVDDIDRQLTEAE